MNKLTLLASTASLLLISQTHAQLTVESPTVKPTCVKKDNDLQGYPQTGQAFSDWDYLAAHESPDYQYRMTGVQLCTDDEGHLRGMEAYVGKFSTESNSLISTLAMNRIGDVSGACKSLHVDPTKQEFIQRIILRAGSSYVDAIWIGASTRQVVYNGNHPAEFTDKVFDFTWDQPLVGFWGSATPGEWIYSLGTVSVETNCVMEENEDSQVIEDITGGPDYQGEGTNDPENGSFFEQWHEHTGLDTETTIFVAAATTTVFVLALALCLGVSAYMKKKSQKVNTGVKFKGDKQDTTDTVDANFEVNKRLSVKKINGKVEIHQQLAQQVGTDIETSEQDLESGRGLSKDKIEQSENVISDTNLGEKFRSPNRNKTFKVVEQKQ